MTENNLVVVQCGTIHESYPGIWRQVALYSVFAWKNAEYWVLEPFNLSVQVKINYTRVHMFLFESRNYYASTRTMFVKQLHLAFQVDPSCRPPSPTTVLNIFANLDKSLSIIP